MNQLNIKHPVIKVMMACSALCIILVTGRIFYTESFRYLWLVWNLFLAWLPLLFILLWHGHEHLKKSTIRSSVVLLSWLLFFPNSPYILTDLFHLLQRTSVPLWYDLILILSFAWTGLLIGFISLIEVQNFFLMKFGKFVSWTVAVFALTLGSFGVYLGRYGRFNSWDVIANPFQLTHKIFDMITDPMDHTRMYGMTFFFSCFLILTYLTLIILIHSKNTTHESLL